MPLPVNNLVSLLGAAFFVKASNAAITTMIGIVIAQRGGDQSEVAFIAACYSAGFLAGCFLSPQQVARVGLIRGFVAGAAILTISIVGIDMTNSSAAWALLRFLMGASMAAVIAACDAWINETTPNEERGSVIAIQSIVYGLAAVASQMVFLLFDVGEDFVLVFAIMMNISVVMVAMTSASAPKTVPIKGRAFGSFAPVSAAATVSAFASGFMIASFVSLVPFYLASNGVPAGLVAMVLASMFLGRLVFQWPVGRVSDRLDRRTVLAGLSTGIILVTVGILLIAALTNTGEGRAVSGDLGLPVQIFAFVCTVLLGGMLYPLYSVTSALAFDRAEGRSKIEVSTTILAIHTVGAIVGPYTVMLLGRLLDNYALFVGLMVMSGLTALVGTVKRFIVEAPSEQSPTLPLQPESSLEMNQVAAELAEETASSNDQSGGPATDTR
ncbi:MAG: MFS transporter [Gammaproteobacteria bacterium]